MHIRTEKDMLALGQRVGERLRAGDILALWGDLGSGKTVLARGAIRARMHEPELEVPSPSFALVQDYSAPRDEGVSVRHADLYRLHSHDECIELGLFENLEDTALLLEWPERLGGHLPGDAAHIRLSVAEGGSARLVETQNMPDHLKPAFS